MALFEIKNKNTHKAVSWITNDLFGLLGSATACPVAIEKKAFISESGSFSHVYTTADIGKLTMCPCTGLNSLNWSDWGRHSVGWVNFWRSHFSWSMSKSSSSSSSLPIIIIITIINRQITVGSGVKSRKVDISTSEVIRWYDACVDYGEEADTDTSWWSPGKNLNPQESSPTSSFSAVSKQKPMKRWDFHQLSTDPKLTPTLHLVKMFHFPNFQLPIELFSLLAVGLG